MTSSLLNAYTEAGRAFVSLALQAVEGSKDASFGSARFKAKQCRKGLSCKGACISKLTECRNPLNGQAKGYAGWLKMQIKAGSGALPSETALKAAIKKAKPIIDDYGSESFNTGGLLKARIRGREYFIKRTKASNLAQSEAMAYEVAKSLGMEDSVLPVKLVNAGGKSHVASPFVALENFRSPTGFPDVRPELLSREESSKMLTFDYVIGMTDRHIGNIALTGGKIKLIDHEFSFGSTFNGAYAASGGFNRRTVEFNTFYDYQRQLNKIDGTPDRPRLIDKEIASKAVSSLDATVASLKRKGLATEGYEKRLGLLKEVIESDEPTFENLVKRMGSDDYS